jgi:uncharacterized membrane protein YuzA (DUF378 family)
MFKDIISGIESKLDEGLLGLSWLLLDIGGIAWGYEALTGQELVAQLLSFVGVDPALDVWVYGLVGVAAAISVGHDVLNYTAKV